MTSRLLIAARVFFVLSALTFLVAIERFPSGSAIPRPAATSSSSVVPVRPRSVPHTLGRGSAADAINPDNLTLARSEGAVADAARRLPIRMTGATIEDLAARDPARALQLALAATDQDLRRELLQAALRGWASADSEAAAAWALSQTDVEQGQAISAVFNGTGQNTAAALRLARQLTEQDPINAASYGGYLIFALNQAGAFEPAANFAASSAPELHTELLTAAYNGWSEIQAKPAFTAAMELQSPEMRLTAVQAVIGGWARTNPRELTELAINFPQGPERTLALTTALRSWIYQDPAAVADWVTRNKFSPEMVAALED